MSETDENNKQVEIATEEKVDTTDTTDTSTVVEQKVVVSDVEKKEPQEDDIVINPTKEEDKSIPIYLQDIPIEKLADLLETRKTLLGEEKFEELQSIKGTYENLLTALVVDYSQEAIRMTDILNKISDTSKLGQEYVVDGKTVLKSVRTPRPKTANGKNIKDRQEARKEFAIKSGLLKRVSLYNSGFHIDLEAPRLTALNEFFTRTYVETTEYGREFGAPFFFFNDLLIKEAIADLFLKQTVDSSLKEWNRGTLLLQHISIFDMKVILTALAGMMFMDGYEFTHVCKNPSGKCTHSETALINLNKLIVTDYMKLSDAAIDHMKIEDVINVAKVAAYQKEVNSSKEVVIGHLRLTLKVPSIAEVLAYGKVFNAELTKNNFADTNGNIYRTLTYSYYKAFTPYVEEIAYLTPEGDVDFSTVEKDAITDELGRLQDTDIKRVFEKEITDYISEREVSYIGYPAVVCPSCGYQPTEPRGFCSVDPEYTFFTLSLKKLSEN